jgi:hypothetical protein
MVEMDERLKKRILLFYAAAGVNVLLGLFVLVFGREILGPDKMVMLMVVCGAFTLLNLVMPGMIKRKWKEDRAKLEAQRAQLRQGGAASGRPRP